MIRYTYSKYYIATDSDLRYIFKRDETNFLRDAHWQYKKKNLFLRVHILPSVATVLLTLQSAKNTESIRTDRYSNLAHNKEFVIEIDKFSIPFNLMQFVKFDMDAGNERQLK